MACQMMVGGEDVVVEMVEVPSVAGGWVWS